jgi:hypothetical protein
VVRALLLAVLSLLLAPAVAAAQFDVRSFSVTPTGLQAGSHPDVTISAAFTPWELANPPEHVRDLTISLPPGLVGDPTATRRCSQAAFQADTCAANTRVGSTSVHTVIPLLIGVPIDATGDVYNLEPAGSEPARLGVVVRPPLGASKVFITSPVRIRPSDGGLDSVITGLPSTIGTPLGELEMWIESMDLTLAAPFASLPTSCAPAQARIAAVSSAGTAASRLAAPFTPTGCDQLPYAPRIEAGIDSSRTPSLRSVITVPRGHAATARASVTLPRGIGINLAALSDVCTLAEQATGSCPVRARIGGALARSPLLPSALTGPVMLAEMPGQPFPGLRLELGGPATLTLAGAVEFSPVIQTVFAGIPDVPLERFELTFDAGRGLRAQADLCRGRQPMVSAELTGHNGAVAQLTEPLAVGGCRPAATLTGRRGKLTLRVDAARGTPLQLVRVTLPRGVTLRSARADGRKKRATRRGRVVTVRTKAARRVVLRLAGRLRKPLVLETRDASGVTLRQRVKR